MAASITDSSSVDHSPFRIQWIIDRFSQMNTKHLFSDVFELGGCKWRVLMFPKGNNVDCLSMYLVVADSYSRPKESQHWFNKHHSYCGFTSFMPLSEFLDSSRGYLVNDVLVVEVEVICDVDENDSAENLRERLKKEQEDLCTIIEKSPQNLSEGFVLERVKKQPENLSTIIKKSPQSFSDGFVQARLKKNQDDLYTIIKVVRDEDLAEQIGNDIYFDLVDYDKVKSFRVPKDTSFNNFKEEVAKELGIPAQFQRFWLWAKRENHTYRPLRPLTQIEEAGRVGELRKGKKVKKAELDLFLEVELGLDLRPIAPLKKRDEDILLFFKLYDPEKEELRYVGRLFVDWFDNVSEILTRLNKLAGYDPDEEIELYEEIKFEPNVMCVPVFKTLTFVESELENGDIICFQKASAMDNAKHIRNPDVPSYLKYVCSLRASTEDEESLKKQTNITTEQINAMIDENVIAAIDRVLSEGIAISVQSQHSVRGQEVSLSLPEQLLGELSDIVFKEDLVEKFKKGLTPEIDFNLVMEKIDAYADLFSSHQLEQLGAVKNLLNNLVRIFEKMEYLKIKQDSAKKSTDKHNEALKKTREKILTAQTSFTSHQTQLNSLDGEIADLKARLENLQVDRDNIAEIQDQEKDKITSLNKEVKSIFHLLVDDHIKVKTVEDKIPEAQADLKNYEKLYQFMKAAPPF